MQINLRANSILIKVAKFWNTQEPTSLCSFVFPAICSLVSLVLATVALHVLYILAFDGGNTGLHLFIKSLSFESFLGILYSLVYSLLGIGAIALVVGAVALVVGAVATLILCAGIFLDRKIDEIFDSSVFYGVSSAAFAVKDKLCVKVNLRQ